RDLARVEQLPDTFGMKDEVVLQRGHDVTWGGHVRQTIEITGARAVEVGAATECGAYQLRHALGPETAAALYVVSHHTVQTGLLDLETFCRVCHEADVPVIVDGAAEPNFRDFVAAGADLVITSAHKVFASLTAGVIAGRKELVQACIWQEKGIGRPMKVGKEGVIGAIAGIERWLALDLEKLAVALEARLERARGRLEGLDGVTVSLEDDWTSRAFRRVRLDIDQARAGISAFQLARRLAAGQPAITLRSLYADQGFLQLDLRRADDATVDWVCARIVEALERGGDDGPARPPSPSDQALAALERWPLPVRRRSGA
ncbi:MAG: aminotransferase class V-fold PLP-dependent enzyme, partial [Geminicoccales bacterium]